MPTTVGTEDNPADLVRNLLILEHDAIGPMRRPLSVSTARTIASRSKASFATMRPTSKTLAALPTVWVLRSPWRAT